MTFSIQTINTGTVRVVAVSGYLGNDEFARLEKTLDHLRQEQPEGIVLDCSCVQFATCISLARLLVQARSFREENIGFKLAKFSPRLESILRSANLDEDFHICPNVAEAVTSLRGQSRRDPAAAVTSVPAIQRTAGATRKPRPGKQCLRASDHTKAVAVEPR